MYVAIAWWLRKMSGYSYLRRHSTKDYSIHWYKITVLGLGVI